MVDDEETKDLITWTGAGDQFTVFNNVDFSRNVLPRYFKHCNWSSFVRQLNSKCLFMVYRQLVQIHE